MNKGAPASATTTLDAPCSLPAVSAASTGDASVTRSAASPPAPDDIRPGVTHATVAATITTEAVTQWFDAISGIRPGRRAGNEREVKR
jgi:hypothetical protein